MIKLKVNGRQYDLDVPDDMPLLWVLRDNLGLTGTKYGCGSGVCGNCMVHINDKTVKSCVTPVISVNGMTVTTIEGISSDDELHPVQKAWIEESVPECGYCQSGQIMAAVSLLKNSPQPSEEEIKSIMSHVLCRCGTYQKIRKAIAKASSYMDAGDANE